MLHNVAFHRQRLIFLPSFSIYNCQNRKKMKKILKFVGVFLISIFSILLILSSIYVYKHYPRKIESYEVNHSDLNKKILIASQGSEFKNALLDNIVGKIQNDSTYVKVINVSELNDIDDAYWRAVIIINTCIADKINKDVKQYLKKSKNKIPTIMLVTAGDGRWKPNNLSVDAISTASRISYIEKLTQEILNLLPYN